MVPTRQQKMTTAANSLPGFSMLTMLQRNDTLSFIQEKSYLWNYVNSTEMQILTDSNLNNNCSRHKFFEKLHFAWRVVVALVEVSWNPYPYWSREWKLDNNVSSTTDRRFLKSRELLELFFSFPLAALSFIRKPTNIRPSSVIQFPLSYYHG